MDRWQITAPETDRRGQGVRERQEEEQTKATVA